MKFKPRHRTRPKGEAPLLIQRGLVNDEIEVRERAIINAFEYGYATTEHFDILADMQGLLLLAGTTSEARRPAMLYAHDVLGPVMQSIRARYDRTKKLGCNANELKVLRQFVSMYRDFWMRQPGELLTACRAQLSIHNAKIAAKRKQEQVAK